MPLKRKLLLYMVGPVFLLCVVGFAGLFSLHRLERAADNILSDNYNSIQEAHRMERMLRELERGPDGSSDPESERAIHDDPAREFEMALQRCERNITEGGEMTLLNDIMCMWKQIRPKLVAVGAHERMMLIAPLFKRVDDLIVVNEKAMFSFERKERRMARVMLGIVGASLGVAFLALIMFALISASRISRPILRAAEDLHRALETKPTTNHFADEPSDEIKRLEGELHDLLNRLSRYEDEQSQKISRLEGRFTFVMEEVQEGLILLDERLEILAVNKVGHAILRVNDDAQLKGNLRRLDLDEGLKSSLQPVLGEELREERDLAEVRFELGGQERIYRPRLLPIASEPGGSEGFLLVFWDVTEERRFEESRRRFIAMLSHQLKTPVTSLSMSVNLLWEKLHGARKESDELLSMARADCAALSSLITELIDAAQEAAPDLSLHPRRVELVRLLRTSLKPLTIQARDKGIELRDGLGAGQVYTEVDPVKFPWVVMNIVGNALRYTHAPGSIRLDMKLAGRDLEIVIADTGVGIAPEDMKRLFIPLAGMEHETGNGSHGLGLNIAKEIVEAHRGTIEVESQLGRGTTFRIRLPVGAGGVREHGTRTG